MFVLFFISLNSLSYPQAASKIVTVTGKVQYNNGIGFPDAVIWFQKTTDNKSYMARADNNGNYSAAVDSGAYYIAVYANYVQGNLLTRRIQYYNNKQSFDSADVIDFNKDTTVLNFSFPVLTLCSISGTIRDAATQKPLSNVFIAVNSIENQDSTFIGTDMNGNYSITVFEGTFTLYAYQPGYFLDYYKDVYDSFDATQVTVNKDSSKAVGIDFNLTKPDSGSNSIAGVVGDPVMLPGVEVYAIPLSGGKWIGTRSGNYGDFIIQNLKSGRYVLLFYKDGYISKYYGDSLNAISLTGNMNLKGIYVVMNKLNPVGGEIYGTIKSNSGISLSGTLILAINSTGDTVSTAISNYTGNYNIPALANGSYTIIANKIGYEKVAYPQQVDINLSSNPIVSGINISIIPTAVEKTENTIPESFVLFQNYPNPFNPSTIIHYEIPNDGLVTLKIYDELGREVKTLIDQYQSKGKYDINFNASQLASGIYFYQLNASTGSAQNFISTKKMLLLK